MLMTISSTMLAAAASVITFAAGAVLAAIIPVALFLVLQRYIVSGLVAGSVK